MQLWELWVALAEVQFAAGGAGAGGIGGLDGLANSRQSPTTGQGNPLHPAPPPANLMTTQQLGENLFWTRLVLSLNLRDEFTRFTAIFPVVISLSAFVAHILG